MRREAAQSQLKGPAPLSTPLIALAILASGVPNRA
jgi:hypothetical protein